MISKIKLEAFKGALATWHVQAGAVHDRIAQNDTMAYLIDWCQKQIPVLYGDTIPMHTSVLPCFCSPGLQGKLSKLNQAYVTMNPASPTSGLQVRRCSVILEPISNVIPVCQCLVLPGHLFASDFLGFKLRSLGCQWLKSLVSLVPLVLDAP